MATPQKPNEGREEKRRADLGNELVVRRRYGSRRVDSRLVFATFQFRTRSVRAKPQYCLVVGQRIDRPVLGRRECSDRVGEREHLVERLSVRERA